VSQGAVQYTCQKQEAEPQHVKAGEKAKIQWTELKRLEEFVTCSAKAHQMTYEEIAKELWPEEEISYQAVQNALHRLGYRRRIATRKSHITETNQVIPLQ